jgi:predicted RND superfamily exporter protein
MRELRPDDRRRSRRGAIELAVAAIVVAVLIAFAVWFFGFAHNPCCSP